jgi:phage terminase large subunit GpA-like protein
MADVCGSPQPDHPDTMKRIARYLEEHYTENIMKISRIAWSVGYEDEKYFSKVFKRRRASRRTSTEDRILPSKINDPGDLRVSSDIR